MTIALLDDIGADLDMAETRRNASRHVERGSLDWPELRRAVLAYGGLPVALIRWGLGLNA